MNAQALEATAKTMVANSKGLLAIDEVFEQKCGDSMCAAEARKK